jgi:hypothetical protein
MENSEIQIEYVSPVEAQLSEIIANQAWWSGSFDKIDKTVRHLEKLVCLVEGIDTFSFSKRLLNTVPKESLKVMNDGYCRWETEVENYFAHELLTKPQTKVEDYLLYERFSRLLTKELALIENVDYQSILFIGSGPFPITAILLHKFTGKQIDCLELNEESANISRKVLKRLGLADSIKVHVGNGSTYDLSRFDIVLVALLAKPKADILANIYQCTKTSARVLCRTSEGMRTLLYESTQKEAFDGYDIRNYQKAGYDDTISTMLLEKKNTKDAGKLVFQWLERMTGDDLTAIHQLQNTVIAEDNNNGFRRSRSVDDYYFQQLKNDVNTGLKKVLIIKDQNRYYGQVILNFFHQDTYAHRADISSLMLVKAIRSKQVSLQVAECLISECERSNLAVVTIDVRAGTGQEKLWKYLGFTPYGELPWYSKVGEQWYSGILMFQNIDQMKVLLKRRLAAMYLK